MQIKFIRWCMDPKGRTPLAVNPDRVDSIEHWGDAFLAGTGENFPAATRITMRSKQEYVVQGTVHVVAMLLNGDVESDDD